MHIPFVALQFATFGIRLGLASRLDWHQRSLLPWWAFFGCIPCCFELSSPLRITLVLATALAQDRMTTLLWLHWHSSLLWFVLGMASAFAYALGWRCSFVRTSWEALVIKPAHVCNGTRSRLGGHTSLVALAVESALVCVWHGISGRVGLALAVCPCFAVSCGSQVYFGSHLSLQRHLLGTQWPRSFGCSGIRVCFSLGFAWHQRSRTT
jgi:hypothetical protein